MKIKAMLAAALVMMLSLTGCVGTESEVDLDDGDGDGEPELEQMIDNQDGGTCSESGRFCIVQCGSGGACVKEVSGGVTTFYCGC